MPPSPSPAPLSSPSLPSPTQRPSPQTPTKWHPSSLLNPTGPSGQHYSVILLNQPLNANALAAVLPHATYVVCADGGANRFLALQRPHRPSPSSTSKSAGQQSSTTTTKETDTKVDDQVDDADKVQNTITRRLPDVITGDLDSLTAEAEEFYRSKGVEIARDPDQYSTDLAKSLKWIRWRVQMNGSDDHDRDHDDEQNATMDVVVLGSLGGRVDQGFSMVHYLYLATGDTSLLRGRIYLLSEQSLTFVLEQGDNEIMLEPEDTFEENVGIIPVMGPTRISTKGLEWDVDDWPTEFGGQLSTSNHLRSDRIWINVNGPKPLMTLELAKRFSIAP